MLIPLFRAQERVDNLFQAFGDIKEAHITALIAYLISAFPQYFGRLFIGEAELLRVDIELVEGQNRYDIVIDTDVGYVVIEAKLDFSQRKRQIESYLKALLKKNKPIKLILLDRGSWDAQMWAKDLRKSFPKRVSIEFMKWGQVHEALSKLCILKRPATANLFQTLVAEELTNYMEANNMSSLERKEIYSRDLRDAETLDLFFRHHIYISQTKFFRSAQGNAYFAPYFTGSAPKTFAERSSVAIGVGISYLAPILNIEQVRRQDIRAFLKKSDVPGWAEAARTILKYDRREKELMIFILDVPFQTFLVPVKKKQLGWTGAMGSKVLTFQQLFRAN